MNIKNIVNFKNDVFALDGLGNLYIHYWNYEKSPKQHEWKFLSNSASDHKQPNKMVNLFSDNRNLYSLSDIGCIFKFVEGKHNLTSYNWRLFQENKFKNNEQLVVKQIISPELILASNNEVYRRGYFDIHPALKDGDSCYQTCMPARENVFCSIRVSVMYSSTTAFPFSYS